MHFFIAIILLVFELLIFYMTGHITVSKLKIEGTAAIKPVIGVFIFYSIITPIYLLCVTMRFSLTVFGIFILLIMCVAVYSYIRSGADNKKNIPEILGGNLVYIVPLILFIILITYYSIRSGYVGADTTFYIQSIRDAAYHDTMYEFFQPGKYGVAYGIKYILCSYYMVLAFFVRVTSLPAIIVARVVGGGCCVLLSICTIYSFAMEIFSDISAALLAACLWISFNFIDISAYTASSFLMNRSYEGKAWCANVILPFLLMLFFHLFRNPKDKNWWILVFIVCFSCDTLSMSALLSAAVIVSICSILLFFKERKAYVIKRWFICTLPLLAYGMVVILGIKGFIRIMA